MRLLAFLLCLLPAIGSAEVIKLPSGGDLRAAITRAQPGDTIELVAGGAYTAQMVLPPKPAGLPITIRTAGTRPDRRALRSDIPLLATIHSGVGVNGAVFECPAGCANWVFEDVHIPSTPTFVGGEIFIIEGGQDITFTRAVLSSDGGDVKRGIRANGHRITVRDSYIGDIWAPFQDSQAIQQTWGSGLAVVNSTLSAASEPFLLGGDDAPTAALLPTNVLLDSSTITKPLAWKGATNRNIKTLVEIKAGKQVLIQNNTLVNNWIAQQAGYAIVITPRNQEGRAPFTVIEDVTIRNNTIDSERGVNIMGYDDDSPSGQATRIAIYDNDFTVETIPFLLRNEIGALAIYRNQITMPPGNPLVSFETGTMSKFGEPKRTALFAVEHLIFAETDAADSYIHSPTIVGPKAFDAYTRTYSLAVPAPDPVQPPPPVVDVTATKLKALTDYLAAMPNFTRIAQIIKYLKAVPK